jgi:hypothetical protein
MIETPQGVQAISDKVFSPMKIRAPHRTVRPVKSCESGDKR